jgi:hypothetical protein
MNAKVTLVRLSAGSRSDVYPIDRAEAMLSFPNGGWQLADNRYSWDAKNKRLVRKKNNADS